MNSTSCCRLTCGAEPATPALLLCLHTSCPTEGDEFVNIITGRVKYQRREYNVLKIYFKAKAVPLHATVALRERGGIAPTHFRPRH
jgi:hypothetical protein